MNEGDERRHGGGAVRVAFEKQIRGLGAGDVPKSELLKRRSNVAPIKPRRSRC